MQLIDKILPSEANNNYLGKPHCIIRTDFYNMFDDLEKFCSFALPRRRAQFYRQYYNL